MAKIQRPSSDLCSAPWPDFRHLLILDIIILDSIYYIFDISHIIYIYIYIMYYRLWIMCFKYYMLYFV